MRSVRCRLCAWIELKLFGRHPSQSWEVVRGHLHSWRYSLTNDAEVWRQDPEFIAVQDAERLAASDPEAALSRLCELAEGGSVWSMLLAGWSYKHGRGVVADQAEAERWYWRAVEGGCQLAQLHLGASYAQRQEFGRYKEVLAVGAREGWGPAMYYLAGAKLRKPRTRRRSQEARILYERAAAKGDLGAQMELGSFMLRGRFGLRLIPRGFRLAVDAVDIIVAVCEQGVSKDQRPDDVQSFTAFRGWLRTAEAGGSSGT